MTTEATTQDEERIPFSCCLDCGSRCELVAVKRGGKLVRIDTPAGRPDTAVLPRLVPCARGRAHRRLLSASERVLHPLRRTGPRGTGEFEEVSWDTALNLVAENLTAIQTEGSTEAVLCGTGAGAA
ncbi:MAG: molybdopterin-dependent oxidoreductase, partial [Lentisphaerae bacterium]|nr:molybdopterin-dependent oxidoreductase [Lentisphaerota bacterium]